MPNYPERFSDLIVPRLFEDMASNVKYICVCRVHLIRSTLLDTTLQADDSQFYVYLSLLRHYIKIGISFGPLNNEQSYY